MKQGMKEPHMEGVANRHGPGSCVQRSNALDEVSLTAGEAQAGTLSSEIIHTGLPALLLDTVGEMACPPGREGTAETAESKTPCERGRFTRENRESPDSARRCCGSVGEGLWPLSPTCTLPGGHTWS